MEFERTNETLTLSSQSSFTATLLGLRSWQKKECEEECVCVCQREATHPVDQSCRVDVLGKVGGGEEAERDGGQ